LEGHNLVTITRPLIGDPFEAQELANHVRDSLAGGSSMRMEVDAGGAAVLLRTLPLVVHGKAVGAAVLIRDVTEVKRRDRALLSKDATIREIHHRVKNNLQTVAALLRLQARRTNNAEGREALIESVRRVSSIALVHDALSMSVDELVQNAIEHAFDTTTQQGCVTIRAERSARWLDVVVHDDGRGLPDGFSLEKSDRLGLQIVRTLVSAELDGSLGMHDVPTGGTDVVLRVPIGRKARLPQ
jgi:two-component sensor histidine kinase